MWTDPVCGSRKLESNPGDTVVTFKSAVAGCELSVKSVERRKLLFDSEESCMRALRSIGSELESIMDLRSAVPVQRFSRDQNETLLVYLQVNRQSTHVCLETALCENRALVQSL